LLLVTLLQGLHLLLCRALLQSAGDLLLLVHHKLMLRRLIAVSNHAAATASRALLQERSLLLPVPLLDHLNLLLACSPLSSSLHLLLLKLLKLLGRERRPTVAGRAVCSVTP
jgi:hypothetical protein